MNKVSIKYNNVSISQIGNLLLSVSWCSNKTITAPNLPLRYACTSRKRFHKLPRCQVVHSFNKNKYHNQISITTKSSEDFESPLPPNLASLQQRYLNKVQLKTLSTEILIPQILNFIQFKFKIYLWYDVAFSLCNDISITHFFLSHNVPCFKCNKAITNCLYYTCVI